MKKTIKKLQSKKTKKKLRYLSRHPFVVPVTTFVVMFFMLLVILVVMGGQTIGATDTKVVQLYVDGESQVIPTRAPTVKDLLERLNITLGKKDIVEPGLDSEITDDNFQINVYKARSILIEDENGKDKVVVSAEPSPRGVVKAAGKKVFPEDIIEQRPLPDQTPSEVIKTGGVQERIVIDRATSVALNIFGTQVNVRTHAKTVDELLNERGIGEVTVLPGRSESLSNDLSIFVTEPGKKLRVVTEEIPFETEHREDYDIELGQEVVKQKGRLGERAVVYEIDNKGNETVFNEVIVREPVKEVVALGRKLGNINVSAQKRDVMAAAGIAETDYQYVDFIVSAESGWNVTVRNRSSGAYGLCQALPGSKMASAGSDWETNPITQLRWCSGYAVGRYGSWSTAYNFWVVNHWW